MEVIPEKSFETQMIDRIADALDGVYRVEASREELAEGIGAALDFIDIYRRSKLGVVEDKNAGGEIPQQRGGDAA